MPPPNEAIRALCALSHSIAASDHVRMSVLTDEPAISPVHFPFGAHPLRSKAYRQAICMRSANFRGSVPVRGR